MCQNPQIISALKQLLASEYVFYQKLWNFHWNYIWREFTERHKFFNDWREVSEDIIDDLAEQIRQLNDVAIWSLWEFLELSKITENPSVLVSENSICILYDDNCYLCDWFREAICLCIENKDEVTANLLQEHARNHDKLWWFLSAMKQWDQ